MTYPQSMAAGSRIRPKASFEISPLFEDRWSGIPLVTAEIAARTLMDMDVDWQFLYANLVVPLDLVELLLVRRSGGGLVERLATLAQGPHFISRAAARDRDCIWPNVKSMSGWFRREAIIMHDLSTLVTPQFHNEDTIKHHANRMSHDCGTSNHIFCVSRATRDDVVGYLGVAPAKTSIIPMGVAVDESTLFEECIARAARPVEPYVVVLGTIEPRKNVGLVVDMLEKQPLLLEGLRIVIIGGDGWLGEKAAIVDRLNMLGLQDDRVIFTGYVSDQIKLRLLLNCRFAIYPSFFEGFGLPVLECAALGKICVASNSSSIPEVAPNACIFFDPTDLDSFGGALGRALIATQPDHRYDRGFHDLMLSMSGQSWDRSYAHIRTWLSEGRDDAC